MIEVRKLIWIFIVLLLMFVTFGTYIVSNGEDVETTVVSEWEMAWDYEEEMSELNAQGLERLETLKWIKMNVESPRPTRENTAQSVWIRLTLPSKPIERTTMLISDIRAKNISVWLNGNLAYENRPTHLYNRLELLIPLDKEEVGQVVHMQLSANKLYWIGLKKPVQLGDFQDMQNIFFWGDLFDPLLGISLAVISLLVLVSITLLNKPYLAGWRSLCIFIFSIGVMLFSYSPTAHMLFPHLNGLMNDAFEISTCLLMPSLFYFFESLFGKSKIMSKFKYLLIVVSAFSILLLILSYYRDSFLNVYIIYGITAFVITIVLGSCLLIWQLIKHAKEGNKEASILGLGLTLFFVIVLIDLGWYFYSNRMQNLVLWKWGIISFIVALLVTLSQRLLYNYEQMKIYSEKVEIFSNELQYSEKMEIITHLAASIAHEVRNPLQVTRGFLQLLDDKASSAKDKSFIRLAVTELDRASTIITDFLTFAKPNLDEQQKLHLQEEFQQITGILAPLATMQGAVIKLNAEPNLYIIGNSSKFKQALINIIKNSLEALSNEGLIEVEVESLDDHKEVIIRVRDNGEGMSEADLKRLGEPYYTKKSKGTGLGLMVTFRLIEAMHGRILFNSRKGVGTEAVLYFPLIQSDIEEEGSIK